MSKTAIVPLPFVLLVIFWWKRGRLSWKRDAAPLIPFFLAGIALGMVTVWVERRFVGAHGDAFTFSFGERCLIAGRAFWFYLSKIFWPANLIFIYPRWKVSSAVWWQYLFPAGALLLGVALTVVRRRRRAPLAVFLYFSAMLFPVAGFISLWAFKYSFVPTITSISRSSGPWSWSRPQ